MGNHVGVGIEATKLDPQLEAPVVDEFVPERQLEVFPGVGYVLAEDWQIVDVALDSFVIGEPHVFGTAFVQLDGDDFGQVILDFLLHSQFRYHAELGEHFVEVEGGSGVENHLPKVEFIRGDVEELGFLVQKQSDSMCIGSLIRKILEKIWFF